MSLEIRSTSEKLVSSASSEPTTSDRLYAEAGMVGKSFSPSVMYDAVAKTASNVVNDPVRYAVEAGVAFGVGAAVAAAEKNPVAGFETSKMVGTVMGTAALAGGIAQVAKPVHDTWVDPSSKDANAVKFADAITNIGLDATTSIVAGQLGIIAGGKLARPAVPEFKDASPTGFLVSPGDKTNPPVFSFNESAFPAAFNEKMPPNIADLHFPKASPDWVPHNVKPTEYPSYNSAQPSYGESVAAAGWDRKELQRVYDSIKVPSFDHQTAFSKNVFVPVVVLPGDSKTSV